MKAVIELDVPEWQIGQDVTIVFRDTMTKHGKCELLKEQQKEIDEIADEYIDLGKEMAKQPKIVRCEDCIECYFASNRIQSEQTLACGKHGIDVTPEWFCADGKRKD